MLAAQRPAVVGYGTAILATVVALLIRLILDPVLGDQSLYIGFTLAVMVSAWYGGLGPGLLATLLSAGAVSLVWLFPAASWSMALPRDIVAVLLFILVGAAISLLNERLRKAWQQAQITAATLQDSEEQIATTLENITDGFFALTPDWNLTYLNAEAERLLGYQRQDVVGRNLWAVFPGAFNTSFHHALELALTEHTTVSVEEYYPPFDRWFEVHAYGSPRGLSVYFHDITERKRTAAELERLTSYHELILESVGEGMIGLDAQGLTTFVNPAAATMLGYDSAELIGQRLHDVIHHTRPDGMPCAPQSCPIVASLSDGSAQQIDADVFWRQNGASFPVSYISTPLREHGAIVGTVLTFRDITARKQAEARRATQYAVTRVLAQSQPLQVAIPRLLETICTGMGWDLGELWRVDPRTQHLRWDGCWYALTVHAAEFTIESRSLTFARGEDLTGRVWAEDRPLWLANVADATFARAEIATDHGLYAAFGVPIRNGREVTGVLLWLNRAMRQPDAELLQMMTDLGSQIGQFIARRQAEAAVERSAARLTALHEMDRAILAAESPVEIAEAALRHLQRLVPYQQAHVEVLDGAHDEQMVLAAADRADQSNGLGRHSMQYVGYSTVAGVVPDQALSPPTADATLRIPLIAHGSMIGALVVVARPGDAYIDEQRTVMYEVAAQLAIAIQQARLFEQVRTGRERLQSLSASLVETQEAERRHIARELHDEIGQALTAVQLNLQAVSSLSELDELPDRLEDSMVLIETVLQQVRTLSLDLRPSILDDLGLASALRWYVKRQATRAGLHIQIDADAITPRPPTNIETACFRVAQEAVTNIVRYAQATSAQIDLHVRDGALELLIRDNGIGFDVAAAQERASHGGSLGLLGMQERALLVGGQCAIQSLPGQGTTIRAHFPLQSTPALEPLKEKDNAA